MIELMVLAVLVVQMAVRMAAALVVPGYAPHSVANVGIERGTNPNKIAIASSARHGYSYYSPLSLFGVSTVSQLSFLGSLGP